MYFGPVMNFKLKQHGDLIWYLKG